MPFRLSYGLKEAERPIHFVYPEELLADDGPYGTALLAVRPFLKKY